MEGRLVPRVRQTGMELQKAELLQFKSRFQCAVARLSNKHSL